MVVATSAAVEPIRTVTVHEMISELMLSPSGARFAARVTDYAESDYRQLPMTFVVEGPDSVEHVSAIALRWASDTSVVTLTPIAGGSLSDLGSGYGGLYGMPAMLTTLLALASIPVAVIAVRRVGPDDHRLRATLVGIDHGAEVGLRDQIPVHDDQGLGGRLG